MSLTIKAKLRHTKVIRRLKLAPNFECVQQRLRQVFEVPDGEKMRVCWRDSDGDLVTLGSECELQDALANDARLTKSGVFCVEVLVKNAHDSLGNSSSGSSGSDDDSDECASRNTQLHPGVVCDGCQHSLRGYRFKCIVCPDYDLCLRCETRGRHCQHDMLLIRKPLGSGACGSGGLSNVLNLLNQFFNVPMHLEVRPDFSGRPNTRVPPCQSQCPVSEPQATPHCTAQARDTQEPLIDDSNSYPRFSGCPTSDAPVPMHRSDEHSVDANSYPRFSGVSTADSTLPTQRSDQHLENSNCYPRFPASSAEATATMQQGCDQDWNMVDHEEVSVVHPDSAQVPDKPTLSPVVNQSREQMIAMGFSDENGVLTNLLQQHNGDIGRVLDILRASY